MTTLEENISVKQTIDINLFNNRTEIVVEEFNTVNITLIQNETNKTIQKNPNEKHSDVQQIPIAYRPFIQIPIAQVTDLLNSLSNQILENIDNPEIKILTAVRAWRANGFPLVFGASTYAINWIWVESKNHNDKHVNFYSVNIFENYGISLGNQRPKPMIRLLGVKKGEQSPILQIPNEKGFIVNQKQSIQTNGKQPVTQPSIKLFQPFQQITTAGLVTDLLNSLHKQIIEKTDHPEVKILTAVRAWRANGPQFFDTPICAIYWIWVEGKNYNDKHISFYSINIIDHYGIYFNGHKSNSVVQLLGVQNGELPATIQIPVGKGIFIDEKPSTQTNVKHSYRSPVLIYKGVQLTNEQFLRIYNKNLAGILQHINNPSIKTLVPINVWVMTGYLYMNAFNYWIWLQAVNNDGTKGNSYSVQIFYQISPVQKDAVSAIFDGLVEPIGGPIFPRIPINYPPKFFPYTQMKTLDNITKLVQENFAQIAQLINYQDNIELTKLTVIKAWISSGPLEHDAPEYIYYWVWLKGETKNNEVGYNIDPQNQYAVELLKKLIPKKGLQVVQTLYGYTQPSK